VLIVDDEPAILELWSRILSEEGYEVVRASDASEALSRLTASRPTVAVCDVHLPGASGLWLAEMIRQQCPQTAIVLASGDPFVPPCETLRPSVVGYILKPIAREELLRVVKTGIAWASRRT
jgi:CheY-like chemotaxis protein